MIWSAITPLPTGLVRLRVFRHSNGRLWLTHDITAPLEEALAELREIARPPPTAWWLEEWRGSGA